MTLVFMLSHVLPADPAMAWARAGTASPVRPETLEAIRQRYHLRDPLYVQYWYYFSALVRGDLGISPYTSRPVIDDLTDYFPATVELASFAMVCAILMGVPIGVWAGVHKDRLPDHLTRVTSLLGVSLPIFWVAIMVQTAFYYQLGIFADPGGG